MRQQRRQSLLHPSPLFDFTVESCAEVANRRLVRRNCAVALFEDTLQRANRLAIWGRNRRSRATDDPEA